MHRAPETPRLLSCDDAAEEVGPRGMIREAKAAAWMRENAQALARSNDWINHHGLPLGRHRPF
jgi:antitoxin CcdA